MCTTNESKHVHLLWTDQSTVQICSTDICSTVQYRYMTAEMRVQRPVCPTQDSALTYECFRLRGSSIGLVARVLPVRTSNQWSRRPSARHQLTKLVYSRTASLKCRKKCAPYRSPSWLIGHSNFAFKGHNDRLPSSTCSLNLMHR